ncbi:MAG: hypothetical protein AAB426_00845 [Myxococcota bacterium]
MSCTGHGTCAATSTGVATCACEADFHAEGLTCIADPVATAPVVTLFANPSTVDSGGTSTLTWSATNATSCTASGAWSGAKATSGSEPTGTITAMSTFTLTCTGSDGSGSRSATVYLAGAGLLFFDDFEYEVRRDDAAAASIFVEQGGWSGAKTQQSYGSGAGYLYTVDTIPGFAGAMPSGRVLAIEAHGQEGGTDFYLQYGGEDPAYDDAIPADVWFQFWHFTNHSGTQLTQVESRHKWLYPCATAYPCHANKWLLSLSAHSYNPLNVTPYGDTTAGGEAFLIARDNTVGDINYSIAASWDANKLGQFRADEYLVPNRWSLVKVHFDTSDAASGKWEAWIRPQGGQSVKVAEWIGGTTPDFTWTLPQAGGHRVLRMPTTIGWTDGLPVSWYYMDDFAMATNEAALPVYP